MLLLLSFGRIPSSQKGSGGSGRLIFSRANGFPFRVRTRGIGNGMGVERRA